MKESRHSALLRIYSSEMDLSVLVSRFGESAKHSRSRSDLKRNGQPWGEAQWTRDSQIQSEWLEDLIEDHVSWLEDKLKEDPKVMTDCVGDIYCVLEPVDNQAGVLICREMMPRLAALNLSLLIGI